jgi:enoyl-CoA hydratase/carnithine racemase
MKTVKLTFQDNHAIVELDRTPAHAINFTMVNDLREAFSHLKESDRVEGAILTAKGNIFCAGLDVVELYGYDEDTMSQFWERFLMLVREMAAFPKPLVAAINGHAPAGGCVFALCCDYRIMADTQTRIGLNEVQVGIVLPPPIIELARFVLGDSPALRHVLNGVLMLPEDAKDCGLIHDIIAPQKLDAWADTKLKTWMNIPQKPWREAKTAVKKPLIDAMSGDISDAIGPTLRYWWSNESRSRLREFIDKLKSKSAS